MDPLTVGDVIEILSRLDPSLPFDVPSVDADYDFTPCRRIRALDLEYFDEDGEPRNRQCVVAEESDGRS